MRLIIIINLILVFNLYSGNTRLKESKNVFYELLAVYGDWAGYINDRITSEELIPVKKALKYLLKNDNDNYDYYRFIYEYPMVCDVIDYFNKFPIKNVGLSKAYDSYYNSKEQVVKEDFLKSMIDLKEFDIPLQLLLKASWYINRYSNKLTAKKYILKLIKEYPNSQYIDDAYLILSWKIPGWDEIDKRIEYTKELMRKYPDSNSECWARVHLIRAYEIKKWNKKAELLIDESIKKFKKENKLELAGFISIRSKYSHYYRSWDEEKQLKFLEEINNYPMNIFLKYELFRYLSIIYQNLKQYNKAIEMKERQKKLVRSKWMRKLIDKTIEKKKKLKEKSK